MRRWRQRRLRHAMKKNINLGFSFGHKTIRLCSFFPLQSRSPHTKPNFAHVFTLVNPYHKTIPRLFWSARALYHFKCFIHSTLSVVAVVVLTFVFFEEGSFLNHFPPKKMYAKFFVCFINCRHHKIHKKTHIFVHNLYMYVYLLLLFRKKNKKYILSHIFFKIVFVILVVFFW